MKENNCINMLINHQKLFKKTYSLMFFYDVLKIKIITTHISKS